MLSRRALIGKLAAGTAGAVVVSARRAKAASVLTRTALANDSADRDRDGLSSAPVATYPPWELLRPLLVGSVIAHGWRLADLSAVRDGSCVVTLRNARGRSHRVHLCLNDGHPHGIVYTHRLDLVLMNGGEGDLPTEEGLAQAVAEVAHVLAANEADANPERFATELLPHAERMRRFASGDALR
jgi:hypothetical protein